MYGLHKSTSQLLNNSDRLPRVLIFQRSLMLDNSDRIPQVRLVQTYLLPKSMSSLLDNPDRLLQVRLVQTSLLPNKSESLPAFSCFKHICCRTTRTGSSMCSWSECTDCTSQRPWCWSTLTGSSRWGCCKGTGCTSQRPCCRTMQTSSPCAALANVSATGHPGQAPPSVAGLNVPSGQLNVRAAG